MKKEQAIHICLEGIYATAEIDQMGVRDLLPKRNTICKQKFCHIIAICVV